MCQGQSEILADATAGGSWSSQNTAVAVISATGIVSGVSAGTSVISYSTASGCAATRIFTITALPDPISGPTFICDVLPHLFNSSPAGGTWAGSAPGIATIDAVTGVLTATGGGAVSITYTSVAGCAAHTIITIQPLPDPGVIRCRNSLCR